MARISQHLIDRYSAGPPRSRMSDAARLQTTIRDVLGHEFDTFLQGSYRNDTGLPNINDVDIVARRKSVRSPQNAYWWESLFADIAQRLSTSARIPGVVSKGDKCVKVTRSIGGLDADVVPAIAKAELGKDPIAIWSRRAQTESPNHPRTHYANGVKKQARTKDTYKATVRLFKRWAAQYAGFDKTAPSFYIECAVHKAADAGFSTYLPLSFFNAGREMLAWTRNTVIKSVAGDKDVLREGEWAPAKFEAFQQRVAPDVVLVGSALRATSTFEADRYWKQAFGE